MSPHRAIGWTVASLAALAAGCAAALGLDAPTLDPCAQGGCSDTGPDVVTGSADATPEQDAPVADSSIDAPIDTDGAPPNGVRCGGGSSGNPTYCMPGTTTPTCCQTTSDAGVTIYGCVASETACTGYTITCATYNDCPGQEICCHYTAHMVCGSSCTSSTDVVCDPALTDSCPTGYKCSVYFSNEGVESPYMGCSQ